MKPRTFVPAAAALLLFASAAHAQDAADSAGTHRTALSLGIGSTTTIGLWRRVAPNVEVGLEVAGSHSESRSANEAHDRSTIVAVQPAVKLYSGPVGPVRPYAYGEAGVAFVVDHAEIQPGTSLVPVERRDRGLNAAVGLGLEWSPVDRITLGGHAGVGAAWLRDTNQVGDDPETVSHTTSFGTFTSGVRVQLYF